MFTRGKQLGWLASNPAEEARIEGRGKTITRERYFSEQEIATILRAAHAVQGTPRENPKTTAAKRWVPWLCVFGGAGGREDPVAQTRCPGGSGWLGDWLTPEAGGIKNNTFRDVPVHQHLIALGFLDLIERANQGPLFCEIGKDGTTTGPAEGVYKRILEVVRSVVPDPKVHPTMPGVIRSRPTATKRAWTI